MPQSTHNAINFIMNKGSVILVADGETRVYAAGSDDFEKAKALILEGDEVGLYDLVNGLKVAIKRAYEGFSVENDVVFIDGEALPELLGRRLKAFADENAPYEYLIKFWNNLKKNPSNNSVNNLFDFLERTHCPIDENGHILLYKTVKNDYFDKYSGKILNKPGTTVEVPRNKVDDNRDNQCSNGLHCGGLAYTNWYGSKGNGDRLLLVSVDPADTVSVPTDHDYKKMRVSKYYIVKEVEWTEDEPTAQTYSYSEDVEDDDLDSEDEDDWGWEDDDIDEDDLDDELDDLDDDDDWDNDDEDEDDSDW